MEPASERRDFRVRGRVQGVGFRWATRRVAEELGLRGWVRNLADGSVEVAAEGRPEAVERLARWLRQGPAGAKVEAVEEVPSGAAVAGDDFSVLR